MSDESNMALVVDDEPGIIATVRALLERDGWQVCTATDLASASRALADAGSRLRLVVTDHVLPDGYGAEWCRTIRESRPEIATLLMSGDLPADLGQAVVGLAKPFDAAQMRSAIATAVAATVRDRRPGQP